MSIAGFKTLLDTGATRAARIAKLASETDESTGIINNVTATGKTYWEKEGPTSTTGTAYAAIVDILDFIHGRTTSLSVALNGNVRINDYGLGIGITPASGNALVVLGNGAFTGNISVLGTMSVIGSASFNSNLVVASTKALNLTDGTLNVANAIGSPSPGVWRNVLTVDANGNLMVVLPADTSSDRSTIDPTSGIARNFGVMAGSECVMYVGENGQLFIGDDMSLANVPFAYKGLSIKTEAPESISMFKTATGGAQDIDFFGNWTPGTAKGSHDASSHAQISHQYSSSSNTFLFSLGGVGLMQLRDESLEVVAASSDLSGTRLIKNGAATRSEDASVDILTVGPGGTWGLFLQQDGYDSNASRLFTKAASGVKAVMLGSPSGTFAAPLDVLAVLDSPFMAIVNGNYKAIAAAHSTKEGLFVGKGNASSVHKGARITLEDAASHRATIQMGTTEEPFFMFSRDGILMTTPSTNDPNNVGTSTVKGAHLVPVYSSIGASSTDTAASLVDELEASGITDIVDGAEACVLCDDHVLIRFIRVSGNWYLFKSTAESA